MTKEQQIYDKCYSAYESMLIRMPQRSARMIYTRLILDIGKILHEKERS